MDGMAGMDHAGMPGVEETGSGADASAEAVSMDGMEGMDGMDHANMAGMEEGSAPATAAAAVGTVTGVEATAGVQGAGAPMRPRARPLALASRD